MGELDDRIAKGLGDLVDRAPIATEVWVETERHVSRHRQRRRAFGAALVVAAVVGAGVAGVLTTRSKPPVRVATTAPVATVPVTTVPVTTVTTSPPTAPRVAVCPLDCVGQLTADVDGDGRPDQIGLFADPPLSGDIMANRPSKLVVRVEFADGRVADYDDSAAWTASLIGAIDLNGDGQAEIFYFNDTGANLFMGHILRWDGTQLVAVQGADGKPFSTFTSGYAMGGDGFRCADNSYIAMTIDKDGVSAAAPSGWTASQTTYRLQGNVLVQAADAQPIAITPQPSGYTGDHYLPPEYNEIIGVHCPGVVPESPYAPNAP